MKTRIITCLLFSLLMTGCTITLSEGGTVAPPPSVVPIGGLPTFDIGGGSGPAPTAAPNASPTPSGWSAVTNGIQWRIMTLKDSFNNNVTVVAVQVDPSKVRFRVLYQQGVARTIQDWHNALPDALMIVNANYFDQTNKAIGLVVTDSNTIGSLTPRTDSGLFQVVSGVARLRYLWLEPYNPGEAVEQAAQAFPLLMAQGQIAPINSDLSTQPSRRTIIAQDSFGNFLFILVPGAGVKLQDLGRMLAASGLSVNTALNMDGGSSTAMYLALPSSNPYIPGLNPVPVVLAVYPR